MLYAELHAHSNFSFLFGAAHPEDLAVRAKALGLAALALTDKGGVYGAVRFAVTAGNIGLKAIIGAEVPLASGYPLTLLCVSQEGYQHLCRLISAANLAAERGKGTITYEALAQHASGLIALSSALEGEVPSLLLRGDYPAARHAADRLRQLFGPENFYLELQHHYLPHEEKVNASLLRLSHELHLPSVATNHVLYATPHQRRLQDILTCIRHKVALDQAGTLLQPNGEFFLKGPEEMAALFRDHPEAVCRTLEIAERCQFDLLGMGALAPAIPLPAGETPASYLRTLVEQGLRERYPAGVPPRVQAQVERELSVIAACGYEHFFLIVADICAFARAHDIEAHARGSAPNSAVCYALKISDVDPDREGVLFERFLSAQRRRPPDIDLDLPSGEAREQVIQYVYAKYGRECAALAATVIVYRPKSAIRDVGKALGIDKAHLDRLSRLADFPDPDRFQEEFLARCDLPPHTAQLYSELVQAIRGYPRHLSQHVGGMVLAPQPVAEMIPIEWAAMPGRSVVQFNKDDLAILGFVKFDLLALGMLHALSLARRLLKAHHGLDGDPAHLSYDDPRVYDLICRGDTVGTFQVESRAQIQTAPRFQPRTLYALAIEIGLIRPGHHVVGNVPSVIERARGRQPITYPHPALEPILKRTYGLFLFQEQVMQASEILGGLTPGEADELRQSLGNERFTQRRRELLTKFIAGARARGVSERGLREILHQLSGFATFGFPETHCLAFATLAYRSCWLKTYYPDIFYTALLNAQPLGFYTPDTLIHDARRHGVEVRPPDVNFSLWDCTVEEPSTDGKGGVVRLGLRYVQGIGPADQERLATARQEGPYHSLSDFIRRTRLPKATLINLAIAGAFGSLGYPRRPALWHIDQAVREASGELPDTNAHVPLALPAMSSWEEARADYRVTGLSTRHHAAAFLRAQLTALGALRIADLPNMPRNLIVRVGGLRTHIQRPATARGWVYLAIEDETGILNVSVPDKLFHKYRPVLLNSLMLLVIGRLERKDATVSVRLKQVVPIAPLPLDRTPKTREFR
jgi:error-prone DNA polymerase